MTDTRPAKVTIRRADLADADQVGMLAERVYRHGGWGDRLRQAAARRPVADRDAVVLVAVDGGVIAGTVTVARPGSRMAGIGRAEEVEVRMLAVDEAARGRGIGDLLMAECEALARDEGYTAVVLSTEPDMHAAQRVYRRRGYVRQPDRDWSIGRSTLLVFQLSL